MFKELIYEYQIQVLSYLAALGEPGFRQDLLQRLQAAQNMTDEAAVMSILANCDGLLLFVSMATIFSFFIVVQEFECSICGTLDRNRYQDYVRHKASKKLRWQVAPGVSHYTNALCDEHTGPEKETALAEFYSKHESQPLVLNKWLAWAAGSDVADNVATARALTKCVQAPHKPKTAFTP